MLRKAECGPVSRAFPFISRKQRKSENQRKMKASMTLEAAFTLSLLDFCVRQPDASCKNHDN